MNQSLMLWPMLGQVLLVVLLYSYLAVVKAREIKAGNVKSDKVALDQEMWPESVRLINNNLRNQFETPILFYVACLMLWGMGAVTQTTFVLGIAYLALRCLHAFVHVTSNDMRVRAPAFILGFTVLIVLFGFAAKALADLS